MEHSTERQEWLEKIGRALADLKQAEKIERRLPSPQREDRGMKRDSTP